MKLFDNKKAQPKVENQKHGSSEIEELKKQNKKLRDDLNHLVSKIDNLNERIYDLKIEDEDRWRSVDHCIREYVEENASRWVEAHIDMAKIEDKVLLKVVKATFNNYKEEKDEK